MKINLEDFEWIDEAPRKEAQGYRWIKIEEGDWIDYGKWEYQTCVVFDTEYSKFYQYKLSRSGSYWTDYSYRHREDGYVVLEEVTQKGRVIVEKYWEKV